MYEVHVGTRISSKNIAYLSWAEIIKDNLSAHYPRHTIKIYLVTKEEVTYE